MTPPPGIQMRSHRMPGVGSALRTRTMWRPGIISAPCPQVPTCGAMVVAGCGGTAPMASHHVGLHVQPVARWPTHPSLQLISDRDRSNNFMDPRADADDRAGYPNRVFHHMGKEPDGKGRGVMTQNNGNGHHASGELAG